MRDGLNGEKKMWRSLARCGSLYASVRRPGSKGHVRVCSIVRAEGQWKGLIYSNGGKRDEAEGEAKSKSAEVVGASVFSPFFLLLSLLTSKNKDRGKREDARFVTRAADGAEHTTTTHALECRARPLRSAAGEGLPFQINRRRLMVAKRLSMIPMASSSSRLRHLAPRTCLSSTQARARAPGTRWPR